MYIYIYIIYIIYIYKIHVIVYLHHHKIPHDIPSIFSTFARLLDVHISQRCDREGWAANVLPAWHLGKCHGTNIDQLKMGYRWLMLKN